MWDNARHGAWLSLVERSVWDRDVAGSNPVAPTKIPRSARSFGRSDVFRHAARCSRIAPAWANPACPERSRGVAPTTLPLSGNLDPRLRNATGASAVSGCVGFSRTFALTFGPSRSQTAPFVRKVSSVFRVVAAVSDAADLLDCAGLNPRQCREYFRNERHDILHTI